MAKKANRGCVYRPKGQQTLMVKYSRRGRVYHHSAGTRDWQEAEDLLKRKQGDLASGKPVVTGKPLTFDQAATMIRNSYAAKDQTVGNLPRRLAHLRQHLGHLLLDEITTTHITNYVVARRKEKAAYGTAYNELAVLRRMIKLGIAAGRLWVMPLFDLSEPKNARKGFFERDQFEAVRAALPEWLQGPVTFAFWTGWRMQSELGMLEWRHVDQDLMIIKLDPNETKNDDGRTFPYGSLPDLVAVMERQQARRVAMRERGIITSRVFTDDDGHSLMNNSNEKLWSRVRRLWKVACTAAGVEGRIPHDFRRTAVRNLVRAGVPEKTAMALTGHKTRVVFERYNIVNEEDLRDAVSKYAAGRRALAAAQQATNRAARQRRAPVKAGRPEQTALRLVSRSRGEEPAGPVPAIAARCPHRSDALLAGRGHEAGMDRMPRHQGLGGTVPPRCRTCGRGTGHRFRSTLKGHTNT